MNFEFWDKLCNRCRDDIRHLVHHCECIAPKQCTNVWMCKRIGAWSCAEINTGNLTANNDEKNR